MVTTDPLSASSLELVMAKTRSMWESLEGRTLEPYEHMAIALHESECIPHGSWQELVSWPTLNERYMNYRWCNHSEDHNVQAAAMFGSLYLQREAQKKESR